ncbi:MAG: DUF5989 family protein [Polyangiales bacterium]
MPHAASPTEPPSRGPLRWLAVFAVLYAAPSVAQGQHPPGRVAAALVGAAVLAIGMVRPRALDAPARVVNAALDRVGDAVSTTLLLALYAALVLPYAWVLRRVGRLPWPDDPWPPEGSGWTPLTDAPAHHRAAGSRLAGLAVRAGGAAALVGFLWRRPSFFLVPLVVIVLLLSAVVLLGSSTGLGPLVYTLF